MCALAPVTDITFKICNKMEVIITFYYCLIWLRKFTTWLTEIQQSDWLAAVVWNFIAQIELLHTVLYILWRYRENQCTTEWVLLRKEVLDGGSSQMGRCNFWYIHKMLAFAGTSFNLSQISETQSIKYLIITEIERKQRFIFYSWSRFSTSKPGLW